MDRARLNVSPVLVPVFFFFFCIRELLNELNFYDGAFNASIDGFLFDDSESSEYSDWTEEVGLRTQQQTENRRPR